MDQLKPAIEFCKKQYFWLLLGMLSLMSIAGFVMTKMSLAAQLKTQQALVDSKYSTVQEVSGKASTPSTRSRLVHVGPRWSTLWSRYVFHQPDDFKLFLGVVQVGQVKKAVQMIPKTQSLTTNRVLRGGVEGCSSEGKG